MNSQRTRRTYDRIGARNYGMILEERIRRMRDNQAYLVAEERGDQQQVEEIEEEGYNQDSYYEEGDEQPLEQPTDNFYVYNQTEEVDADMPSNDRILYYSMYVQHFGISLVQVKRMQALMVVIYGSAPPITYEQNVASFNSDALTEYNIKRTYYCSSCEGMLSQWRYVCDNEGCELHRVSIKRAKGVQRIEVHVLDIIPQQNDIILREIKNIIEFHRFLHENRESPANDRSDIRFFPDFYRSIETAEEFNGGQLKLLLSLSVDGCVPKRITRREMWPLYLRVDNLPKKEADKYLISLLSGIIFSLTKPTAKMLETLFSRLEAELSALRSEPIEIDVDGYGWTIGVTLNKGVADLAAQQGLFGVPRWSSEQGCSKCYITGQRTEGQRVWISGDNENTDLRPPESYVVDGQRGANGIPRATPLMRIIEPCRFPGDALHVCSEGITKNRLRDLFSRQSRFRDLLVNRQGTESIKKCLKEMSCYTYASSLILSLDDLRTCKAAELDEHSSLFPLSSAAGLIPSPLAAISLLGYWLCLRIIADSRDLTTVSIEKAQKLASLTQQIWTSTAPEIFTMKCHWFFDHGMKEEITSYGSAYQWSSAPFESHHRRLQIKVDQSTTNSSATIVEKYLLYKKMRNLFENRAVHYPAMTSLRNKVDNKHRTRFPVGISLSDSTYQKTAGWNHINCKKYTDSEYPNPARIGIFAVCLSTRPSHSRQDMVYLKGRDGSEEIDCFGSIEQHQQVKTSLMMKMRQSAEQVARPGNVNNRPEFNFEEAPIETRREPASLYECVSNGTLDMNKAARLILKQKRDGSFNQSVYDEFVRSEVASRVHYFRNNGILDISDTVLEMRLTGIMNYMMADLKQMIVNYHPKEKETPFQLFAGLFRYIVMRATNPPQKIQEYSLRLNWRNGRVDTLMNLPESIQNLLLDFAEDLIGDGHNELRAPEADKTSSFFIKLGSTDEERQQEFDMLQQERVLFRKDSFKGLQLALRDVRSYVYDTTKAQWMPGDRKAKRTRLEVEQENAEPTEE